MAKAVPKAAPKGKAKWLARDGRATTATSASESLQVGRAPADELTA